MTTPTPGTPCEPWEFDPQCCTADDTATPEQILRARRIATDLLWALAGRRHGPSCPVTVLPCVRPCGSLSNTWTGFYGAPWYPYIDGTGTWRNAVCGCGQDPCEGTPGASVALVGPVYDVIGVTVDGVAVPDTAWRVDFVPNQGWVLVRTDGEMWPTGTGLAVTYRTGIRLDYAGQAAFDSLVCHLLRDCGGVGPCSCKLPVNVTRTVRQGVTMEYQDATELRLNGFTGIPAVDAWLRAVNPYGMTSYSRVASPDYRPGRVTIIP